MVWSPESLYAADALALHNTGTALVVGAANAGEGCNPARGLWYRPLGSGSDWRPSDVGDWLCIKDRDPRALSNIVALASLRDQPSVVYALTGDSGLLVSDDGGAHFRPHPAGHPGASATERLAGENKPELLVVSGGQAPIFWVTGQRSGLLVYRDNRWMRLDGRDGCAGLTSGLAVRSLLVTGQRVLIGSDQQGLWVSDDAGATCRRVFDASSRYVFYKLLDISQGDSGHYLALVYDTTLEPDGSLGTWQLLDICPLAALCSATQWQAEPDSLWDESVTVEDVLVQADKPGSYEWYLVTEFGQVWRGDLQGGAPLYGVNRCYIQPCDAHLAPAAPGEYPYLLAAGRVYRFIDGEWWRRWWT